MSSGVAAVRWEWPECSSRSSTAGDEKGRKQLGRRGVGGTSWEHVCLCAMRHKWLQDYLNEYVWRYNHRHDSRAMFDLLISRAVEG